MVGQSLLVVAQTDGILDRVQRGATTTTMSGLVLLVAGLVSQALTSALLRVRLDLAGGL